MTLSLRIVDTAVDALNGAGLPAQRAYPGSAMPHLTQGMLTVQLEKLDYISRTATVLVTAWMPVEQGGSACEALAVRAGQVLASLGAAVTQESCRFEAYADAYAVQMRGTCSGGTVTELWDTAPSFTVELDEKALGSAVSFRANRAVDENTGQPLEDGLWTFRLEEQFGWEAGPMPGPTESFTVTVLRNSGMEIYSNCDWTSIQLEDTATGLRQVRTGVAQSRSFMVVG